MLGVIRGIIRPENTNAAFVREAAGTDTGYSISESQIRNTRANLVNKLNGKRKLWNSIENPINSAINKLSGY